jgi:dolichyl-phosphate-mannose-protein mannosyltransferase
LHYLPFYVMGRSLFLHHYLPALLYSIMLCANVFDFALRRENETVKNIFLGILVSAFTYGFYLFSPFVYGTELTPEQVSDRKWLSTWDFQYASNKE